VFPQKGVEFAMHKEHEFSATPKIIASILGVIISVCAMKLRKFLACGGPVCAEPAIAKPTFSDENQLKVSLLSPR
jgi:hypothetical protein